MSWLPLKRFVDPLRPITYGIVQAGPDYPGGVRYIRPADMTEHDGVLDVSALRTTSPDIAAQYQRSTVKAGDIVVSIGPSFGKTMIVPTDLSGANLTQGTARVAPGPQVDARFLRWALRASQAIEYWETCASGATFRALNLGPLTETPIPSMSHQRQRAIADYLDAETARIDALMAKKAHLLELLQEWRWARLEGNIISRGEDGTIALKRTARVFVDGDWIESPYITDSGIRLIQTGNIGRGEFVNQGSRYISEETFRSLNCTEVLPGDVLISRLANTVGQACVAPNLGCRMVASVDVVILRPQSDFDAEFLVCYLSTHQHLSRARLEARGSTMQRLARSQLGELRVPVLGIVDQRQVAEEATRVTQTSSPLAERLIRQTALLEERRTALITLAVTGELGISGAA